MSFVFLSGIPIPGVCEVLLYGMKVTVMGPIMMAESIVSARC